MNDLGFYDLLTRCRDGTVVVTAFKESGEKEFFRSTDPDELRAAVEQLSQESIAVYVDRNLRRFDLPPGVRGTDDNVVVINSITVDCDLLGPAHTETRLPETIEDAKKPLGRFPEPTILADSGYGLYAEWYFEEPIKLTGADIREKVEGIFRGFGRAAISAYVEYGYKLDNVFTISHMFRAIGSFNNKLEAPVECRVLSNSGIFYTLDDFAKYYEAPTATEHEPFEVDERVVGSADRIMEHCPFVRKMLDDPNAVTEPEWKAACDNISLASDGPDRFHEWSSLYSNYSYEETEYKIQRSLAAKKPCTCKYIHESLGFECPDGGCGVKAPIVHALYSKQEQMQNLLEKDKPTDDEVYDPYFLGLAAYAKENCPAEYGRLKLMVRKAGVGLRDFERAVNNEAEKRREPAFDIEPTEIRLDGIDLHGAMEPPGYRISLEDGVTQTRYEDGIPILVCLCHETVVITRRLENIDTGQEKLSLSHYRNSRWKEIIAPRSSVLNKNKLVSLADSGLPVSSDNAEGVVRYLSAYEAANSKRIPFIRSINRIGWIGTEFYPCLTNEEIVYEGDDTDNLVGAITELGNYELWLKTAEELRKNPFARIVMAASFASPLLELLQNRVIIVHLWHSSRSGKTAALKFALSIWGDPMRLMGNFNSTAVGLERRAGTLKHLPLGLDELQVLNEKRLSPSLIVYSLGNGYGKTRGSKSGGLQDVPTWRNCIISTGEQPLSNESSMDGVESRVLELYGPPITDVEEGRRIHQISECNYGYAGKRYIHFIVNTILTSKDNIRQDYENIREKLQSGFDDDPGAHLDNIAVLALADCYSSVSLFGMAEEDAVAEAVSLGNTILQNAKSLEKEDVVERAWHFLEDWVASNKTRFESTISPCYGKIETNKVYIIAAVLKQAMEEGGYSYSKSIRGFRDRGYIEVFANAEGEENTQCQKKIQGINIRAVCIKLNVQPDADDFLTDPIVPLTGPK